MLTFEKVCEMLRNKEPFTLSRFGDGEFRAITGAAGANCDGHQYFPNMGQALRDIIEGEKRYYWACHLMSTVTDKEAIEQYLFAKDLRIEWDCCSGIFHEEIKHGRIGKIIEAVKDRRVILVAPEYLGEIIPCDNIVVPEKDCWKATEHVLKALDFYSESKAKYVVLFCASMAANVWIDEVFGKFHTLVDLGSGLDYHAKNPIRSYIRKRLVKDETPTP